MIADYLTDAFTDGGVGIVARASGMTNVARDTGLSRENHLRELEEARHAKRI